MIRKAEAVQRPKNVALADRVWQEGRTDVAIRYSDDFFAYLF